MGFASPSAPRRSGSISDPVSRPAPVAVSVTAPLDGEWRVSAGAGSSPTASGESSCCEPVTAAELASRLSAQLELVAHNVYYEPPQPVLPPGCHHSRKPCPCRTKELISMVEVKTLTALAGQY